MHPWEWDCCVQMIPDSPLSLQNTALVAARCLELGASQSLVRNDFKSGTKTKKLRKINS